MTNQTRSLPRRLWRWFCLLCIGGAAGCLLFVLGIAWWLSRQHHQPFLTQQLSAVLGAEVGVASSAVSLRRGLGIRLERVTVRNQSDAAPFFTAEHIDVLLDLVALLRGQLLFRHVYCLSPRIQLGTGEGTMATPALVSRLGLGRGENAAETQARQDWFSPTLALRHLVLQGGEVQYASSQQVGGVILTGIALDLTLGEHGGIAARFAAALGPSGEMGQFAFQSHLPAWKPNTVLSEIEWRGAVQVYDLSVDQLGRWLGKEWPLSTLNFSGHCLGKGTTELELTGEAAVNEMQLGAVQVRHGKTRLTKLVWREPDHLSVQVELADVRGEVGREFLPITLHSGSLTLQQGRLAVSGISGTYGRSSTITEVEGTVQHVFSAQEMVLDLSLAASLDLEEGLGKFLASQIGTEIAHFSQRYVTRPRGQALVRLAVQGPLGAPGYGGEVVFQAAQADLPAWNLQLSDLGGIVRLRDGTLSADALRFQIGQSSIGIQGSIADALSAQRRADLHVEAEVDLGGGLVPLLAVLPGGEQAELLKQVEQPHGRVQVSLRLQGQPADLTYDGQVRFQQVAFLLPTWGANISGLAGTVRFDPITLKTNALLLQIGESSFQVRGEGRNYLSPQRNAELHLAVLKAYDRDIVAFFPPGKLLARGGSLTGHIDVSLPADRRKLQTAGELTVNSIALSPVSFLQPLEVLQGQLSWRGQTGTFTVSQGQLSGRALTGQGKFRSIDPPHIELAAHVTDLDLEAVLMLDSPPKKKENEESKTTDAVVQLTLTSDRLSYHSLRAEDLRLVCRWHDRQAELTLAGAKLGGGDVDGQAVVWPDRQAVFLAPHLTDVDVAHFLQALGQPHSILTGSLTGNGQIHIPDWSRWRNMADWDASLSLTIRDGSLQKLPVLVRLWSVVSLQGLLSFELPSLTTGLAFSSLTGDLAIEKGMLRTDNLVLNSSAVRFDTSGSLDLASQRLDLTTALVPLHGLTSSVAKVPLAGKLLARGADRLTTLPFQVAGQLGDPTVTPLVVNIR